MEKITIEIDKETLEKALFLAQARQTSLSNLIAETIKLLAAPHVINDPIIGMVADEPELADAILKNIEQKRSKDPLLPLLGTLQAKQNDIGENHDFYLSQGYQQEIALEQ